MFEWVIIAIGAAVVLALLPFYVIILSHAFYSGKVTAMKRLFCHEKENEEETK